MQLENGEDDDVIFCGSEALPVPMESKEMKSSAQNMSSFLSNFNLINPDEPLPKRRRPSCSAFFNNANLNLFSDPSEKLRRLPRRTRSAITLSKCTSIPLSSPCGQFLLKSIKTIMSKDYQMERLERLERFCFAPPLAREGTVVINRPKWMIRNKSNYNINISFKKGSDEQDCYHNYKFPRRQHSSSCKKRNFSFYNKLLLNKCKPCVIMLEKLTAQEIENRNIDIRLRRLNITKASNRASGKNAHIVVDCIDLCSSDDEQTRTGNDMSISLQDSENERMVEFDIQQENEELKQLLLNMETSTQNIRSSSRYGTNNCSLLKLNEAASFQQLSTSRLLLDIRNISPGSGRPSLVSDTPNMLHIASQTEDPVKAVYHRSPSCSMNLAEIKENRVNDWVNTASTSMESTHLLESHHSSTTSLITKALSSSCLTNSSNNNITATVKTSPSTVQQTKMTSCCVRVCNEQ